MTSAAMGMTTMPPTPMVRKPTYMAARAASGGRSDRAPTSLGSRTVRTR